MEFLFSVVTMSKWTSRKNLGSYFVCYFLHIWKDTRLVQLWKQLYWLFQNCHESSVICFGQKVNFLPFFSLINAFFLHIAFLPCVHFTNVRNGKIVSYQNVTNELNMSVTVKKPAEVFSCAAIETGKAFSLCLHYSLTRTMLIRIFNSNLYENSNIPYEKLQIFFALQTKG